MERFSLALDNMSLNPPCFTQDDHRYMGVALALAQDAARNGEVPVGAVLVRGDHMICGAANMPISEYDMTAHAEICVLRNAGRMLGNYRLPGCTLYVTLEPCCMCAGAIIHARLDRVVYAASDPRTGAAGSQFNLLPNPAHNHQPIVEGGLRAEESAAILKSFFAAKRGKKN